MNEAAAVTRTVCAVHKAVHSITASVSLAITEGSGKHQASGESGEARSMRWHHHDDRGQFADSDKAQSHAKYETKLAAAVVVAVGTVAHAVVLRYDKSNVLSLSPRLPVALCIRLSSILHDRRSTDGSLSKRTNMARKRARTRREGKANRALHPAWRRAVCFPAEQEPCFTVPQTQHKLRVVPTVCEARCCMGAVHCRMGDSPHFRLRQC